MAEKKTIASRVGKVAAQRTYDTGLKAKGSATIIIPGRGRVEVPSPEGNVYVKGSYVKDAGLGKKPTRDTSSEWINMEDYLQYIATPPSGSGSRVQPGRGAASEGSWIQFTDPVHVKVDPPGKGSGSKLTGQQSYTNDDPNHIEDWVGAPPPGSNPDNGKFAISGTISKRDYLYLARRGCVIKDGFLFVPAAHLEAVKKHFKTK